MAFTGTSIISTLELYLQTNKLNYPQISPNNTSVTKDTRKINRRSARKYGSRKGALLTYWYRTLYLLGKYRTYRQVDWDRVDRLVFVCRGNICRSAYAEVVAKSIGIESISCGIDTVTGAPANNEAIKVSSIRGFNLSDHQTTPIKSLVFRKGDLLVAMEPWQAGYLHHEFPTEECSLLGLWGKPVIPHIQDPYGYSQVYFENCFSYIENSIYGIAKKLESENADK